MGVHATALTAALTIFAGSFLSAAHAAATRPSPRPAPAVSSGSCSFKSTEIAAASSFDQSISASFVRLGDAGSITFTQDKTGCVGGTFFANAGNGDPDDHILLQILLDGTPCAPLTSGYIFANSGPDVTSHSAAFFCGARIAPGKHRVQVQYASGLGGDAQIFQRTLEVTHE
ncbi:MAG TPA: hypothetical protein VHY79_17640 [Rhizomicrobium sp.]|jgi:hypothetical protein|nr:hypothetical protein [Rhizomicrobium sp.]